MYKRHTIFNTTVSLLLFMLPGFSSALTFLDIWEYRVEGNTLLSQDLVARSVTPYLGVARTIDDVDKATQALQQEYRLAGYPTVIVRVPDQDIIDGVVKLEVVETKLRRIKITGSRYFTLSGIRSRVPSLAEGQALHIPTLQNELNRANQFNGDLKIVPLITQGPTIETVDVELSVSDEKPLHGGLSISNYHTENTTNQRLSAQLSYNNLWQKSHQFSIQAQTSPENTDEVNVLALSYLLPVDENGNKLAIYSVTSDSEISTVSDVNVIGDGTTVGFRYVMPFQQSRKIHSVSIGADYKDFEEDLVLIDGSLQQTPIDYVSWSAEYNLFSQSNNVTTELGAGITFGIRGLLNDGDEFNDKRSVATPNFAIIDFDWKRKYRVFDSWYFSHQLRLQISDSPLVSNEQISAGGVETVRGYYESQVQGDYGLVANLELESQNFAKDIPSFNSAKALWFYDAAKIRLREPLAEQDDEFTIHSTGFGLRIKMLDHLGLTIDSGYVLRDSGTVKKDDVRTRARLSLEF